MEIVVPDTIQQYWVANTTTGAYTITVKTASGSGVAIPQNGRSILYCDGVDVYAADTGGLSVPVAISQGGTGATTAGGARTNLGGTSTGIAIFTAPSELSVWTTLGVAPAGVVNGGTF